MLNITNLAIDKMFAGLVLVFGLTIADSAAADMDLPEEFDIPEGATIVCDDEIQAYPTLGKLKWPAKKELPRVVVTGAEATAVVNLVLQRVREVLRDSELPLDLATRVIPLHHYVDGCDAAILRFKSKSFQIHIVMTSAQMRIGLRRMPEKQPLTREEMLTFAQETIRRFFMKTEEILRTKYMIQEKGGCLHARNPIFEQGSYAMDKVQNWSETVEWWTNGNLLYVSLYPTMGTASGGPVDEKDWFSHLRHKSRFEKKNE